MEGLVVWTISSKLKPPYIRLGEELNEGSVESEGVSVPDGIKEGIEEGLVVEGKGDGIEDGYKTSKEFFERSIRESSWSQPSPSMHSKLTKKVGCADGAVDSLLGVNVGSSSLQAREPLPTLIVMDDGTLSLRIVLLHTKKFMSILLLVENVP